MRPYSTIFVLLVGGIVAASSLIILRKPNAKELLDRVAPYQLAFGIALLIWAIVDAVWIVRSIGVILKNSPSSALLLLVSASTELLLGLLLGPAAKGQVLRQHTAPLQGIVGVIAILLGLMLAGHQVFG